MLLPAVDAAVKWHAAIARGGVPIFARTFLLLLAALAVAYAIGMALLALRKPHAGGATVGSGGTAVDPDAVGQPTAAGAAKSTRRRVPNPVSTARRTLRTLLAQWLDMPEDRVRFYVAVPNMLPPYRASSVVRTGPRDLRATECSTS